MGKDFSNKNLQNESFVNADLVEANFSDSDLRGADFTGANLSSADFIHVKTGLRPSILILLFIAALAVSILSGYIAMLAGRTVQTMLASKDANVRAAAIFTMVVVVLFIAYYYWKGGGKALKNFMLPAIIIAIFIGIVAYISKLGTGLGMLYVVFSLLLVTVMFIVGTVARTAAGSLSNILFVIVALAGGIFGKSVGGGIGAAIMAISCALISKRALSGAKGFDTLRKIGIYITRKFGTSFRNSNLTDADFSNSKIHNTDFTNADTTLVEWGNSKKINCLINEVKFTVVK
jgi:uncharacterized protein YjbI with pentapeptide repeats